VGPFLTISRQAIVDLSSPWDPESVIREYFEQSNGGPAPDLSPDDVAALADGGAFLLELDHRWMGRVQAEMRIEVVSPMQLAISVDGAWWLTWWVRPVAILFRGRLRRWVNRRIDEMLEELSQDQPLDGTDESAEEPAMASNPAPDEPEKGIRLTLEILTPAGKRIYRHTEGSL
jgi:hypothetical protein